MKTIYIISALILIVILLGSGFFIVTKNSSKPQNGQSSNQEKIAISGTIDLNGSPQSGAKIVVSQREFGSKDGFKPFATSVASQDKASWVFSSAVSGKSYEIQATLVADGKTLDSSDPLSVTAPASDEIIIFNIQAPAGSTNAVISGLVNLNGYVPPTATIMVETRVSGVKDFTKIAENLPAKSGQTISFANATSGQDYDLRATLLDVSGSSLGQSKTIVVTAPAYNETLAINSTAVTPLAPKPQGAASPSPVGSGTISGKINLNGPSPANSSLVILASETGKNSYSVVVNGIPIQDNASWSWGSANSSTTYDLVAVLKQQNPNGTQNDVAKSQTITVASPAQNQILSLNTGFSLPQPTGNIQVNCGNKDNNNNWSASVQFQSVTGAQSYWMQIGTSNGGSDTVNNTNQSATNDPNQNVNVSIKDGNTYYARYAYANSNNASSNQFSPFSSVTTIKCPK